MSLSAVSNLPTPMKVGAAVVGGAGVLSILSIVGGGKVVAIAASGLIVVALVMVGHKKLMKWRAKAKAAPLMSKVSENAKAAPQQVSDAAGRARLDELRKKFESGITEFRKAGKDIYTLPWYMLIGEPGSGKTEAIRHAQLPFPQGMNDPLQGSGGTVNMDWWFTNKAIVLDTAGRFVFEQVEAGSTGEWKEFLKLLRTYRRDCPINGLVLVIPADSLIKDTADVIERKAGKIARQLDVIQRTLDVRFPVFILVTKSDMIYGFREFFETLDDPQLQHQILGWSNPTDRDTPFDPALVQQHLEQVRGRLLRRRMSLMLDPAHRDNPTDGRRIDEVDAMYAFPESLVKIGPRLRRYLEMIFVAGEWSSKPLFLRGIYFTSSMRKGDALDAELAEALGVGVEDLPEGKVFHEERAFFLRDLFLDKVFKEKGLVTKSVNTKGLQRRRKMIVVASGILVLGSLIVLSGVSWWALERTVGKRLGEWKDVAKAIEENYPSADDLSVVQAGGYAGRQPVAIEGRPPLVEYVAERARLWEEEAVRTPRMFAVTASVVGLFDSKPPEPKRQEAVRAIFETRVLLPLVQVSAERLRAMAANGTWNERSEDAAAALAQLVRINSAGQGGPDTRINLEALFRLVLAEAGGAYEEDRAKLQTALDTFYADGAAWRDACERLRRDPVVVAAAKDGLAEFVRTWDLRATVEGPELGALASLRTALAEFASAEVDLQRLAEIGANAAPDDLSMLGPGRSFSTSWGQRFAKVKGAHDRAVPHAGVLDGHATFAAAHAAAIEALKAEASASFLAMIESLPASSGSDGAGWTAKALEEKRDEVVRKVEEAVTPEVTAAVAQIDADGLVAVTPGDARAFAARYAGMYAPVDAVLTRRVREGVGLEGFKQERAELQSAIDAARQRVNDTPGAELRAAPLFAGAAEVCGTTLDIAKRQQEHLLVKAVLEDRGRADAPPIEDLVKQVAEASGEAKPLGERLPMGMEREVTPSTSFAPRAAESVVGSWKTIGDMVAEGDGAALDAESLGEVHRRNDRAVQVYIDRYYAYWTRDFVEALGPEPAESWGAYREAFVAMTLKQLRDAVPEAQRVAEEALVAFESMVARSDARVAAVRGYRDAAAKFDAEIKSDKYRTSFSALLSGVESLPLKGDEARRKLLAKAPRDVTGLIAGDLYIEPAEGELASLGQAYLNHLFLSGLSRIDQDCQSAAAASFAKIIEVGDRFPLARDANPQEALSALEVRDLWERTKELRPATAAEAPRTVAEGAKAPGAPRLTDQLGKLRDAARLTGSRDEWFGRVARSLEILAGGGEPSATLYLLPPMTIARLDPKVRPGQAGTIMASSELKYMKLIWRAPTRMPTRNFNVNVGEPTELAQGFPISGESLEVRMGQSEADLDDSAPATAKVAASLYSRWTLLPVLLTRGVWWAPDPPVAGSPMWVVPVELTPSSADDPNRWAYVLGIKNFAAMSEEDVNNWPTLDLWERANQAR